MVTEMRPARVDGDEAMAQALAEREPDLATGADLALVLALDGSASVSFDEFNLIAGGLAAAFRLPAVGRALIAGPHQASLCAVLVFSGAGSNDVACGWTRIDSAQSASGFAAQIDAAPRRPRPGLTAIGDALLASLALLALAPQAASRQLVDVAGDGRSNDGLPAALVRDRMVSAGIVINGLCVLHEEPDLLASYRAEVIGGRGSFALTCADYAGFAEAMRRKLLAEITGAPIV